MVWNHNGSQWFLGIPWPPAKSSPKQAEIYQADPKETYKSRKEGKNRYQNGYVFQGLCSVSYYLFQLFEQMHSCLTKKNCTDWMFQKLSFPQSICRILSATLQATWYQGTPKDWNLNFKPNGHSNYMAFNSQSRLRVWCQDKNLESWNRKYIAVALSNVQVVYN